MIDRRNGLTCADSISAVAKRLVDLIEPVTPADVEIHSGSYSPSGGNR
jgi:hypothetical protein